MAAGHGGNGGLGRPRGDSGAAGGRAVPGGCWGNPHPLRLAQRPEGPRSALPAEHLPLGTAWRYAGPPPTKGKGAPPGQPLGLELVLFPCARLPPSEQIPHCPPASCSQPLLQCCTPRWEEQGPAVHELSFIGSSQSVWGGGGQCERPLGVELRAGLAAVGSCRAGGPRRAGPAGAAGTRLWRFSACPSVHGALWLSVGIARSGEVLRGEREGRAGAPRQPSSSGGISLHVPHAPHVPWSGLTSSQLPPAAPWPGAQLAASSLGHTDGDSHCVQHSQEVRLPLMHSGLRGLCFACGSVPSRTRCGGAG